MKRLFTLLVFVVAPAFGFDGSAASVTGSYQTPPDTHVTILALLPNGSYFARWDLDITPEYGRASGTWRLDRDEVHLTPKNEEGGLKGRLTVMLVREMNGRRALLRKQDAGVADNPWFYFYKEEEPNQSPQRNAMARPYSAFESRSSRG